MSADPALHDDLYHPVIRRKATKPTATVSADDPSDPGTEPQADA